LAIAAFLRPGAIDGDDQFLLGIAVLVENSNSDVLVVQSA
jgi:hypothetical protein